MKILAWIVCAIRGHEDVFTSEPPTDEERRYAERAGAVQILKRVSGYMPALRTNQMNQPTVCAICLVNGRSEMVERAVRSFRAQTYDPIKRLLVMFDTGEVPYQVTASDCENEAHLWGPQHRGLTIGALRNMANQCAAADIIVHMDSDDWNHPRRIEEQVALLQASGKECVGYRDMLFWDTHNCKHGSDITCEEAEAWLYSNNDLRYCLGTSFCYWRRVWEARPFPDEPKRKGGTGEDVQWLREVDSLGITSLEPHRLSEPDEPRMIASIHESNTQDYSLLLAESPSWSRIPEWDAYCAEKMQL